MRKILLSTVAIAAMTGSAFAADLPSRKEAPVYVAPAPVFSWTGFYAGVEGGYDFLNTNYSAYGHNNLDAGLIGGAVGYNYQINQFVIGLEGNAGAVLGTSRNLFVPGNNVGTINTDSSYYGDIRGRLGLAYDRALFYVAGGVAFGDLNTKYYGPNGGFQSAVNSDRTGWTIGGGMDYAITPNWIGRIEYRYTDLGSSYDSFANTRIRNDSSAVLVGLMYKFGAPEMAQAAKY